MKLIKKQKNTQEKGDIYNWKNLVNKNEKQIQHFLFLSFQTLITNYFLLDSKSTYNQIFKIYNKINILKQTLTQK